MRVRVKSDNATLVLDLSGHNGNEAVKIIAIDPGITFCFGTNQNELNAVDDASGIPRGGIPIDSTKWPPLEFPDFADKLYARSSSDGDVEVLTYKTSRVGQATQTVNRNQNYLRR